MLSTWWFSLFGRDVAQAQPLRSLGRRRPPPVAAPPRLEQLEDRLAPTINPLLHPVIVTHPGAFVLPAGLAMIDPGDRVRGNIAQSGQADQFALVLAGSGELVIRAAPLFGSALHPHVTLQEADGQVLLDSTATTTAVFVVQPPEAQTYLLTVDGGEFGDTTGAYQLTARFLPAPFVTGSILGSAGTDALGSEIGNHRLLPFLALLAGTELNLSDLGDGAIRSALLGFLTSQPSLANSLQQLVASTTTVPAHNEPPGQGLSFSASALAAFPSGVVSGLQNGIPLPSEPLGFSAFNSAVLMTPAKDRPTAFELSPYAPAGLDIVPILVPRGLEEWFSQLLSVPPRGPSTAQPRDGLLGTKSGPNGTALRDAVFQMLQNSWAPPTQGIVPPPKAPEQSGSPIVSPSPTDAPAAIGYRPSEAVTDALFIAGPLLAAESDTGSANPPIEISSGSMIALLAAGVSQAAWRERRLDERKPERR